MLKRKGLHKIADTRLRSQGHCSANPWCLKFSYNKNQRDALILHIYLWNRTLHVHVHSTTTPDDGQKTCLKHVEFYSKNKFEKLVHLVGFIIRIYHDAQSSECQV